MKKLRELEEWGQSVDNHKTEQKIASLLNRGLGVKSWWWLDFLLLVYLSCDGNWLFTSCLILCLTFMVHIHGTYSVLLFTIFCAIKSTLYSVFYLLSRVHSLTVKNMMLTAVLGWCCVSPAWKWKCESESVKMKVWKWKCESESVKVKVWKWKCESVKVIVWKCHVWSISFQFQTWQYCAVCFSGSEEKRVSLTDLKCKRCNWDWYAEDAWDCMFL